MVNYMNKAFFAMGIAMIASSLSSAKAADNKQDFISDWWNQSINVIGSYNTRFGPQITNSTYLEYETFGRKGWLDFYGYIDAPVFFGGNTDAKGIWNHGSPLFMEIEPRFSIDKLSGTNLSFGPFKEWYFSNNYLYDMGRNESGRQSTWFIGLGTDIDTGLPISLSINVYAKYQWQNYKAANENEWDGYRVKVKYFVPVAPLWGGQLSYIGFTNIDWNSELGNKDFRDIGGKPARTNDSVASTHILALNYENWHYAVVARYWHNGGQWNDDTNLNFGSGDFNVHSTGWGGYIIVGYSF